MADQSILPLDLQSFPNCIAPTTAAALPAGSVVRPSGANLAVAAKADNVTDGAGTLGLCIRASQANEPCPVRFAGPVELTHAQWDAIAGTSGGLVPNTPYFLSAATGGFITSVAPSASGSIALQVGVAISSTVLVVQIHNQYSVNG